ncbi:MAG: glycosyltransferase [Saprospiraceae bacterium]
MRILCTVTNDLSYDQRMQRICTSLAAQGYAVQLVGRQLPQSMPLVDRPFEQKRLRCRFHRGFLFYAEYNLRLFIYLLTARYDAVCSVDLDTLVAGCCATLLRRKKRVFDAHEYFTEVPEVVHRPVVRAFWELVARCCLPFYRQAYTVGPALAGIFEKKYGLAFAVVRNTPLTLLGAASLAPPIPPVKGGSGIEQGEAPQSSLKTEPNALQFSPPFPRGSGIEQGEAPQSSLKTEPNALNAGEQFSSPLPRGDGMEENETPQSSLKTEHNELSASEQFSPPFPRGDGGAYPTTQTTTNTPLPILLYQGALNAGRGLEAAIAAMQQIANVQLWLAGEGDLSGELRQLTEQLGLQNKVRFLGFVQPEELKTLTARAWVGLNLLENRGQSYYYSLANKFFDYVQAGVPVLTMNFPEYRTLNDQYEVALLLNDLSPGVVVEAIRLLQNDPALYTRLQAGEAQARETWTWKEDEKILLAIWDRVKRGG